MTDEKLIHDFLEKNYRVLTDDVYFKVAEKDSYKRVTVNEFLQTFKTIFGDFTTIDNETSIELFYKWFSSHKRILVKTLADYVESLDMKEGSVSILFKTINRFSHGKDSGLYTGNFIEQYVTDYYKENVITPMLKKTISDFKTELGSKILVDSIADRLEYETPKIYEYAVSYLNNWYADSVVGGKMRDFLSQLVITLGTRNWVVTWIGHGPLSRDKILAQFKNETEFHHEFIMKMFDDWYSEAVIDASERELNRNSYGNTFPSLQLGRNF